MKKSINVIKKNKNSLFLYGALIIGILSCCFTRLNFNIAICAFIFPPCFLYFVRKSKPLKGLLLTFVGLLLGSFISVLGILNYSYFGLMVLSGVLIGIVTFIPYLLDKLVYTRFFKNPLAITFLFPLTWITMEVILEFTPIGSLVSIAYSQTYILPLIESVSLLGLYFISFIILTFDSALVAFIIAPKKNKRGLIIATSLLAFSFLYSGIYLITPLSTNETITITTGYSTNDDSLASRRKWSIDENISWFNKDAVVAKNNHSDLLVYPEEAFYIYSNEHDEFLMRCKNVCRENNVYAVLGVQITNSATDQHSKNQAWVIDNQGELKAIYKKVHLLPFDEVDYEIGDGTIPLIETPFGKMAVVICMDMEFPSFISAVGRMGADLLIAPSWFWNEAPKSIFYNDRYRAIENGVNVVKVTEEGYSVAFDYRGQVKCEYYNTTDFKTKQTNHVFQLPKKGITTVYSYLGGFVNYLYIVALAGVITFSIIDSNRQKKHI